jgi:parallel beta-helix repeat protein
LTGPAGPEPSLNIANNSATSITLADTDNNKVIHCTASSAVTITVPSTLAAGFSCMVIQAGVGRVTFQAGSGATINSFGNLLATAGQHAPASLIRVGAGAYNLSGNLA